jgi:hypothetical protein
MLKNPAKATEFYSDSRDRIFNVRCILKKGWLARLRAIRRLPEADKLGGLLHHICLTN